MTTVLSAPVGVDVPAEVSVVHAQARCDDPAAVQRAADAWWAQVHGRWHGRERAELLLEPHVAAYRSFAGTLGLRPDKSPPSVQALIDRGVRGKPLGQWPRINPVVDLLNASAATSLVALGVFDATRVSGPITLARSNGGERFEPLGGRETQLPAGVLAVQDGVRVLSLFAQRDGVHQAVTAETEDLLVLACVVPGVAHFDAEQAVEMFVEEVSC